MRMLLRHIALLLLAAAGQNLAAQESGSNKLIEAILESQLENLDEETDVSLVIEDLEELAEHPLNINATSKTELSRLYILNEIQIEKLLDYVNQFGPVYSIYELNAIDGFTPGLLEKLQPFIRFEVPEQPGTKLPESFKKGRHEVLLRVLGNTQKARGFLEKEDGTTPYEGNRFRYYSRYRFEAGELFSAGITAEKDPGEPFFTGSNKKGFDFYSGHVSFKISRKIPALTAGDYIIRAGQGLVLWQGYTNGKSVYTLDIARTAQGARPYTSVDENRFFRGITTTLKLGNFQTDLFFSQKDADANLDSLNGSPRFTSLQTSGYHRTAGEIADEKSVRHLSAGALSGYTFKNFKLALTLLYDRFNYKWVPQERLYNLYRFRGKENFNAGMNYLFNKGKYLLFGEAALSKSGGKAFLQGVTAHLHDQLGVSLLYRHFDKDYHAFHAGTFAESENVFNESGLYVGMRILPFRKLTVSGYADFYRAPWISYSTAAPSGGTDFLFQTDWHFSPKLELYFRYKNEEKQQKFTEDNRYVNLPERNQKARIHVQYKPSESIQLRSRVELSGYKAQAAEHGALVYQDVQFSPLKIPLKIAARVAWFSTGGFNTRIYVYENDLLYAFSIPAYFGKGWRSYLYLSYDGLKNINLEFKLGNTRYTDREIIGSGYNGISGKNKTEVKFQLRLKI